MKKEHNKLLTLFLLSIFIINIFIGVVNAKEGESNAMAGKIIIEIKTTEKKIADQIKAGTNNILTIVFGKTLAGESIYDMAFTKFLLFILILAIVYGISDVLPFLSDDKKTNTAIKWVVSIIVAYFSVAFMPVKQVYGLMVGYEALGVILTAIIPFILIFGMTWRLAENPNPSRMLVQKLLMWGFIFFLVYRLIDLYIAGQYNEGILWPYATFVYVIMLLVMIGYIFAEHTIRNFILTTKVKGYIEQSKVMSKQEAMADAAALRQKAEAARRSGQTNTAETLEKAAERLEESAKEFK